MATNWTTIVSADLNDYLDNSQITALRSRALVSGQVDPFANTMAAVTDRIRGKLKPKFAVSATAHTVPPELKQCACLLILQQMSARLPELKLTADQKEMFKMAAADLDEIEETDAGAVSYTQPTDPLTQDFAIANRIQVVNPNTRLATRSTQDGLV